MFDIGWSELLVIGVVALIVVGPKDLPDMFRTLGRVTAKARNMAREFQRAMEAAADETGVKDVAKDLKNTTSPRSMGLDAVKQAAERFEKWDPMKPARPVVPSEPAAGPISQAQAQQGPGAAAASAPPPAAPADGKSDA
ncbi:Sec-independent protein translocase protein TatB [Cereibacter sphaeroides]|uniref:Sec-independent protein translocase protein TatB n=1 Tax=Rhodobacterales TaxID=204455 RepID=UPI000BBEE66C|nr:MULTISPECIES: Sec-independent protein translocase protein TatB [Paracoccaceae]MCE6953364.1 Sec-independent protein translocase protein TatB [Cereibacter sphaeroides]MCE6960345.1 Sec-independent protein translocase protein TatB [Cereibacter sphaeroides]MCE6969294.1 Sec-independent protein translocase protein TatB [Cereibacter sphaeroides]MCE6975353.1 Sec-independent protein translocase protein TatB [Cereibacter sphaeroides]